MSVFHAGIKRIADRVQQDMEHDDCIQAIFKLAQ